MGKRETKHDQSQEAGLLKCQRELASKQEMPRDKEGAHNGRSFRKETTTLSVND